MRLKGVGMLSIACDALDVVRVKIAQRSGPRTVTAAQQVNNRQYILYV